MTPAARLKAAVEVLDEIAMRHRPASEALSDWGKSHRFAGSGDRAAIGTLVYDVLRRRSSLAARMGSHTSRALVIGATPGAFGLDPARAATLADGSPHGLEPLSALEHAALAGDLARDTPPHILGDIPEWLTPSLARVFGKGVAAEGIALAARAPVDVRVNTLKSTREKTLAALAAFGALATPLSPLGVRVPAPHGAARAPHLEVEAAHGKGWFEIQDEGSQIAALMAGASPRAQVLDLCAGSGGKTLAFSAVMQNTGQIYAYDSDKSQLRPIFERLQRAGARNVQVMNGGDEAALLALGGRFDLVVIDAPCTGSGTWRRRPDAKWRLKPQNLVQRIADQRAVLTLGSQLVKPGGRVVYVTCSLLAEENTDQVAWFLKKNPAFALLPFAEVWQAHLGTATPTSADGRDDALLLTPAQHGTDGFFIATFTRGSG